MTQPRRAVKIQKINENKGEQIRGAEQGKQRSRRKTRGGKHSRSRAEEQSKGGHQRRRGAEQRSEAKHQNGKNTDGQKKADGKKATTAHDRKDQKRQEQHKHQTRDKKTHTTTRPSKERAFSCSFKTLGIVFFQGAGRRAPRHLLRENALGSLRIITSYRGFGGGVLPRTGVMVLPNHQGTGIVVMIRGCIVGIRW